VKNYQKVLLPAVLSALLAGCRRNEIPDAGNPMSRLNPRVITAVSPAGDVVGKITVGYQGWFSCGGDGSPLNWGHTNLETWPDVRQYTNTYAPVPFYQAGMQQPGFTGTLGNGAAAKIFSSYDPLVSDLHCLWMQQSGIDCIALQRFGSYVSSTNLLNFYNGVASHMLTAAQAHGLKAYIMYDCSTADSTKIRNDWTNVIAGSQHFTALPAYAHQNGKPVVCLYGIQASNRGPAAGWVSVINWFKARGCYVIGSPQHNFAVDTAYQTAYNACNMIMPWQVGRSTGTNFQTIYASDLAYCNAHGIDYQADVHPGSAFYNTTGNTIRKNQVPRAHGDFMWSQFAGAKNAGVSSIYISMFDEMNEATAILNSAEDANDLPAGNYFLSMDADGAHVSADFYLRLVRDGSKMIKGLIPYTATHPTPHVLTPPASLTPHVQSSSSILINWSAATGAPSYNLKRATVNGGPYITVASDVTAVTYTDTGLAPNMTYYYVLTSGHINGGESIISRQASAKTNP
jgi:hypothetical protein